MKNSVLRWICGGLAGLGVMGMAGAEEEGRWEEARRYHEARGGQALVIWQDGEKVFERYANGGRPERRQALASGTKSFCGVVALAAVADGLIELDAPVSAAVTEWQEDADKAGITWRQLLTLTSGLQEVRGGGPTAPPSWGEVLEGRATGRPGERFVYGPTAFNVFGAALERVLGGETYEAYLERRVLAPLGITVEWRARGRDGKPQVAGGAAMTARDWAVFGEWVRKGGRWAEEGEEVGSRVETWTRGTETNPAYGLTWWVKAEVPARVMAGSALMRREMKPLLEAEWVPDDFFMAAGLGKQRLYVMPSRGLVVARLGPLSGGRDYDDAAFLKALLEREGGGGGEEVASSG